MEESNNIVAITISPAKDAHRRSGKGFSLLEIKEAGKTVEQIRELNIPIDFFRKSKHEANIEILKKLKIASKKGSKKRPYEYKEKKRTPFKPQEEKPKKKTPKAKVPKKPKTVKKAPAPKKERIKKEPKTVTAEISGAETTKLTSLSGLGPATAKKFEELGVNCIEELVNEDAAELATLIKGVSEERIVNWISECKEILNQ